MRAVPTWVDKVHDRDRVEQVRLGSSGNSHIVVGTFNYEVFRVFSVYDRSCDSQY